MGAKDARGVLSGGGETGALMRSIDWSKTAVGPVEGWPQSLRTALSILLETGFPMYIAWGPSFTQFYNDGFRPILGSTKHPAAMGIGTRETFAEIWHIIGPMFEGVMRGTPVFLRDFHLFLDRHGFSEECYFIFSYSPIREEAGDVGGVLVTVTETTDRVLGARRLATLQELAARAQEADSVARACAVAAEVIAGNPADLPFALVYRLDDFERPVRATLAGATPGITPPPAAAVALDAPGAPFALDAVARDREARIVACPPMLRAVGTSPLPERALVLPIATPGASRPSGILVAGLSPCLLFDAPYRSFLELVAGHIGAAIASVRALEEAQARAEALAEIDRAKTAFFSNVSHEFRTPLTLLLGPAEEALADDSTLSPAERERWSLVRRNALRMLRLVNTLLDFSRIEAGRVEARYEPTDLAAVTAELASMFRSAIERGGLRLALDLPPLGELAWVDRDLWEKIVFNLLSNALKFTFAGEIAVSLAIDGDAFRLAVRDTGVGIAEAELALVFDRFHRVRGARARTHEGTGIGLALVAELARMHGGSAGVESREGEGTSVTIRVPRGHAHLPAERIGPARTAATPWEGAAPFLEEASRWLDGEGPEAPPSPGAALDHTAGSRPARARIVLADDNADMRAYLARLLGERWDVEAVGDGAAALAALRRVPADLVVADVMMPLLDGFGLVAAVRGDPALRPTPILLVSARAGEEATAEGLAAGADDYLAKPFSARELVVRVAARLAVAAVAREARTIEEAVRARLFRHFEQAPFPIAVTRGPRHELELANESALRAWGRDASIVGKPLIEAMPELRGQPFIGYLDDVLRTGVAFEAHATLARVARLPGGELDDVYFDFVYAPLREADGTVGGILVSGFEVTAQVLAQKELGRLLAATEASARQLRDLVENLPELAWTARADGYIDYYNRRWYEYTGTTQEQMVGWGWRSVHDPARVDAVEARWRQSIESGEPFEMEFPLRGADGVLRWFLTRIRPLRDAEGRIVRWFGSNTNIDERRRNDEFKEMFLGMVGHDLRTPLATILTTARVLAMREAAPADLPRRVARMVSSGERMQRMIEQLLDLTRARLAGGIPVERSDAPVDIAPLVARIVDELRAAHPGRAVELRVEGECSARVDVDRLEQVVSNLVGNAITHGDPAAPVAVTLAAAGDVVRFATHNRGRPIDPGELPVLFNPFERGGARRSVGAAAGLGLGLYISQQIVRAHGGAISVESSEAAGTRFEVVLPRG